MYGYKVNIKGLPETVFACSTTVDNYNWKNNNDKNTIEISVSKAKSTTSVVNNKTYSFSDCVHLSCVVGNQERYSFCDSGVENEITTVAVRFDSISITACELSENDADDNSCFLFPAFSENPFQIREITRLLNKYINCSTSDAVYDKAQCVSLWFNMLYFIDKDTRQLLSAQKRNSDNYYIKKINYIIENRYNENISLTEIAKEFGVSLSYLSSTFSTATHQSFKEALFSLRMKKAKELILSTDFSLEDIADAVGICDEFYLRKCFKRFYGVSISEFKKINKGLTLYHDKPLRK